MAGTLERIWVMLRGSAIPDAQRAREADLDADDASERAEHLAQALRDVESFPASVRPEAAAAGMRDIAHRALYEWGEPR